MEAGEKIRELRAAIALAAENTKQRKSHMEELESHELPRLLGRLIAGLDLQREFISMGIHIRRFTDAVLVTGHLQPLLEERLEREGTIASWKLLDDIIALCKAFGQHT